MGYFRSTLERCETSTACRGTISDTDHEKRCKYCRCRYAKSDGFRHCHRIGSETKDLEHVEVRFLGSLLSSWLELPIGHICWLVQNITVEERVRVFDLQENPGTHANSDQRVHFAIINTRHVNDVFTPDPRYISRSGDELKVKLEEIQLVCEAAGVERPLFQLTVDKLAYKEQAPVPFEGFWTANGPGLPITAICNALTCWRLFWQWLASVLSWAKAASCSFC